MKHQLHKAFTLIELCVVLVIIAIAAAMVFPWSNRQDIPREQFRKSMQHLAAAGTNAKNLAVSTSKLHVLHVELDEGRFYIAVEDEDTPLEGTLSSLPDGSRFNRAELESEQASGVLKIRFAPDGWADNASITAIGPAGRSTPPQTITVAFTLNCGTLRLSDSASLR